MVFAMAFASRKSRISVLLRHGEAVAGARIARAFT
jgi:hypothetical protein